MGLTHSLMCQFKQRLVVNGRNLLSCPILPRTCGRDGILKNLLCIGLSSGVLDNLGLLVGRRRRVYQRSASSGLLH